MDQIVIEAHPNDAIGNTVLLFGSPRNGGAIQTIYDVADASNTIPYEITMRVNLSMRVAMKYINV